MMAETHQKDDDIHMDNDNNDIGEDDSDDEEDEGLDLYLDETTLQILKQNKSITHLSVKLNRYDSDEEPFFNSVDWKEEGDCISNNTQLKTIEISHHFQPYVLGEQGQNFPTREQLQDFFSCVHRNNSIKHISFNSICVSDDFGVGVIEGLQGHPSLTELAIYDGKIGSLGKVLKHPKSKVKELRLHDNNIDNQGFSALCDSLLGYSRMKRLSLDRNDQITSVGWRALSTVLQHPCCKLGELVLNCSGICDMGAEALGSGSSIRTLYLGSNNSISDEGWQNMFNQLAQQTRTEKLIVNYNNINDDGIAELASIGTLKSLDLVHNKAITPSGWQSFFNSLAIRGIQLVNLGISFNQIGIEGIFALTSLLSNMSSLKTC